MPKNDLMPEGQPYTLEQAAMLQEMMAGACEAEEVFELDDLERHADNQRMAEAELAISILPRERCVELLTAVSIQCYDHEGIDTLREAVLVNVKDGTISARRVLE